MRHGTTGEIGLGDEDMGNGTWRVPDRARRGRGMDPATRKLALLAAGVGGAVVLSVGLWSMMGHRNAVVPVIQADSRPVRVKPENPGGLQIIGSIDEIGDGGSGTSKMSAGPEVPQPKMLREQQEDAAPLARPIKLAVPAPSGADTLSDQSDAPAHPPISGMPDKSGAAAPVAPKTAVPKGTQVQLAALGSEDAARAEWAHLSKRFPDLLGGRQPSFSKTERDGKVFWRLRTGGFTDTAQATGFCERARAKGATCSIASY